MSLLGRVRAAVVLTAYWAAACHAVPAEQPRAAVCFFGLTRSLAYTIENIRSSIFDQLISNGINYSVFVHTYSVTVVCRAASSKEVPDSVCSDEAHPEIVGDRNQNLFDRIRTVAGQQSKKQGA